MMRSLTVIFVLSLFAFKIFFDFNFANAKANTPSFQNVEKEMKVGEEITYVVRFGFIELGEIKLKILNKKLQNGKHVFFTVAYIDSYSGVPFVNLHQIYQSKVNDSYFSNFFRGLVRKEKYTTFTEYYFDYKKSKIRVKKGKVEPEELWTDSTTAAETMYHDGLSIFYYARMNTGTKKSVSLPCFVNEEKVYTRVNFYDSIEKLKIDAVDYDIATVRLDGETDFVSVFGLTGYFEGWFSNDEAAIPIIAKMKVIIGNVTLELKSWKRAGWNPPKFQR